jgi:hypothetical protein
LLDGLGMGATHVTGARDSESDFFHR